MPYEGERLFPRQLTAASQLERNRIVKITSGVPAYPTYGDEPAGVTRSRGDANDYETQVQPLDHPDGTFFVRLAGTVTANAPLFVTGTIGAVKASDGTVVSRSVTIPGSPSSGDKYIVPANSTLLAAWNATLDPDAAAGDVATYTASWASATPSAGDVYYVEDEGAYVIYNGSAWVTTPIVCYATQAGSSGEEIACYNNKRATQVSYADLDDGVRPAYTVVAAGSTASETDADAEVVHLDQRILATDIAIVTFQSVTNAVFIQKAVCSAQTLTITLSGNGGAATICNFVILRPSS